MNDDLISRQEAFDTIENTDWYHLNAKGEMVSGANRARHQAWYKADDIYKVLEELPSAQSERKRGKWLLEKIYEDEHGIEEFNYFCSECGAPAYEFSQPYCHRCGAKMRKTEAKYEQEALSRL